MVREAFAKAKVRAAHAATAKAKLDDETAVLLRALDGSLPVHWLAREAKDIYTALRIADEKQAYLLTDKGTYLAQKSKLNLVPLVAGDPELINRYSVIVVSAAKHPGLHQAEAQKFADFLTSPETKKLIAEFGKEKYGESLFRPAP